MRRNPQSRQEGSDYKGLANRQEKESRFFAAAAGFSAGAGSLEILTLDTEDVLVGTVSLGAAVLLAWISSNASKEAETFRNLERSQR